MFKWNKYSANVICFDNRDAIVYLYRKFWNKEIIICHYSQQHCMKRYRQQSSEDVQSPARHEIALYGLNSVAVLHKRRTLPIKYETSSFALGPETVCTCLQPNAVLAGHSFFGVIHYWAKHVILHPRHTMLVPHLTGITPKSVFVLLCLSVKTHYPCHVTDGTLRHKVPPPNH